VTRDRSSDPENKTPVQLAQKRALFLVSLAVFVFPGKPVGARKLNFKSAQAAF